MMARVAQADGHLEAVGPALRLFFCMPVAHSKDNADQDLSVELGARLGPTARPHAEGAS